MLDADPYPDPDSVNLDPQDHNTTQLVLYNYVATFIFSIIIIIIINTLLLL
jgi:hypothetical protein